MTKHEFSDEDRYAALKRRVYERLETRAAKVQRNKQSEITTGKIGEEALAVWTIAGMHLRKMPDDEDEILRISIGGRHDIPDTKYCVFRGDKHECLKLLEEAARAIKSTVNKNE